MMMCKFGVSQSITARINILNDKKEIAANATAEILQNVDSSLLFTKTSSKTTIFTLKNNAEYILRITAVNTKTFYQKLQTGNNDTTLNIILQIATRQLDEVVVNSRTPLLKQEDDKTIVDAEQLASSSTNAF